MLFFPYQLDLPYRQRVNLTGTPFFTVIIGAVCVLLFALQLYSSHDYKEKTLNYCKHDATDSFLTPLSRIAESTLSESCTSLLTNLDRSSGPDTKLEYIAFKAQLSSSEQLSIAKELDRFNSIVPDPITVEWWFNPQNPKIQTYLTSTFLHGSWKHLIINLIFFFAFSIAVEQLIGSILYLAFFAICCITTSLAYEWGVFGVQAFFPTIGLSGFITALMAFIAVVFPLKKILVFFLIVIFPLTLKIPALFLVALYVISDLYGLAYLSDKTNTGYTSHLAGSATGFLVAVLYLGVKFIINLVQPNPATSDTE